MESLRRTCSRLLFIVLLVGTIAANAAAGEYEGARSTQIKKSTTASNGQKLQYLKTDRPEATMLLVEIPPGGETGWHTHPVPVYAYVLSGTIVVEFENGERHEFKAGEAIFETINTPHNGRNEGAVPVKLIALYTGQEGTPNTVKVERK